MGCRIEVDMILLADDWRLGREPVSASAALEPLGHEPQAMRAGDFLFFSTQLAAGPEGIDGEKPAILADHRMLCPLGTDITEDDRITAIKDRLGASIIANTMRVHTVIRRASHIECHLEEVANA